VAVPPAVAVPSTVAIAPLDEALTFARTADGDRRRVLAVTAYAAGEVVGVDLDALLGRAFTDPLAALDAVGADALRDAVRHAPPTAVRRVRATALDVPLDLGDHHVAAGTNYPEHADEAAVKDGPFLFAKLVRPTPPGAAVPVGDALLDYEVELAWVTLDPLAPGVRPERMGLVLCNDYTDRATLLRHVDPWQPASGTGFTTGKSRPGYLPVGDLFVVPRDPRAFARTLELRLWVGDALRQASPVAAQIWDLDAMLAETWARRDVRWAHGDARVGLLPAGAPAIPPRTLLLSGTPGGTVFAGVDRRTQLAGVGRWLAGGLRRSLTAQVVETYIERARIARSYLQPGTRVTIHVDRLGMIANAIVP
jgi:2-keto-4-pentenoate hydratase/2-oxohepta-3-ene-1,7-dioic acid hydratase in catechol pathway